MIKSLILNPIGLNLVILLTACSDVVTHHYPTYEEAKNDHLFIRGWLPEILPVSTINIQTANDLDSNISNGLFSIPVTELPLFISKLNPVSDQKFSYIQNHYEWTYTINHETGHVRYHVGRMLK